MRWLLPVQVPGRHGLPGKLFVHAVPPAGGLFLNATTAGALRLLQLRPDAGVVSGRRVALQGLLAAVPVAIAQIRAVSHYLGGTVSLRHSGMLCRRPCILAWRWAIFSLEGLLGAADRPALGHGRPLSSLGRRTFFRTEPEQLQDDCKVRKLVSRGGRWSALGGRHRSWPARAWTSWEETIPPGAGRSAQC